VDRLRRAGLGLGIVTNQSGIARGLVRSADVTAVNRRVSDLLGPFDVVAVCPHEPGDGCRCRKPAPGLVEDAATALGVATSRCVVVGDIAADVEAAVAAGARAVLVPTTMTRAEEVAAARARAGEGVVVVPDLARATCTILHWALWGCAASWEA
jgi:D-glycero-D-manno-heptose 1,7-bisphosphate phosphatase